MPFLYGHNDKHLRRTLDDRGWKGVFAGYALDSLSYLIWIPRTRRLVRSRNVVLMSYLLQAPPSWGREECLYCTLMATIYMMKVALQ
jgi:hypothetical protein